MRKKAELRERVEEYSDEEEEDNFEVWPASPRHTLKIAMTECLAISMMDLYVLLEFDQSKGCIQRTKSTYDVIKHSFI